MYLLYEILDTMFPFSSQENVQSMAHKLSQKYIFLSVQVTVTMAIVVVHCTSLFPKEGTRNLQLLKIFKINEEQPLIKKDY